VPRLAQGISDTFQRIGLPIILAAIIGACLLHSGAAHSLILALSRLLGQQRLAPTLMISGFVLGIPIYFDTVFYLLLPLAKVFAARHKTKAVLVVMSIIVGATMAHSLVPPTPGPLLVASQLGISLGTAMLGGIVVGGTASFAGYLYAVWCNHWMSISILGSTDSTSPSNQVANETTAVPNPPKVHALIAGLPLLIPIVCLGSTEIYKHLSLSGNSPNSAQSDQTLHSTDGLLLLFGDPNFVLLISAAMSYLLLRRAVSAKESTPLIAKALSDAGVILLLTCAGGAFGTALGQLGVAGALAELAPNLTATYSLLPTAFLLTGLIRVAQGSATVAMITSVGIVSPLVVDQTLPFHPVYVALAIGSGSKLMPWMNDSGFWQVSTMTGMSIQQTLKTFSAALTLMGCVGFLVTLLGAWLLPLI
jgi:GntP family gluconate:H+ symporter